MRREPKLKLLEKVLSKERGFLVALLAALGIMYIILNLVNASVNCSFNTGNWISNYYDKICFSGISATGNFMGVNIGNVSYVDISTNSLLFNGLPVWNGTDSIRIEGYNASNDLVGNVTAYPYNNGLLVSLMTTNNRTYNSIALFFNELAQTPTYFYSNYSYAESEIPINSTIASSRNNYLIRFTNNALAYNLYSYLTPKFSFNGCINTGSAGTLNASCSFTFNPLQSYFVYQLNDYQYYQPVFLGLPKPTVQLYYIIPTGNGQETVSEFNTNAVTQRELIQSTSATGLLNAQLFNNTELPFSAVIEPYSILCGHAGYNFYGILYNCSDVLSYPYYLLSYNIGQYSGNQLLFNATASTSGDFSANFKNNFATLTLNSGNVFTTNSSIIIVPAYTQTYSNSIVYMNSSPAAPPASVNSLCHAYGKFCYLSRQLITDINWQYQFGVNIPSSILQNVSGFTNPANSLLQFNNTAQPYVNILKVTVPYQPSMGGSCQYVNFFNQTGSIYSSVNFSVINCNSTTLNATFALWFQDNSSSFAPLGEYNSVWMYFGSIVNETAGSGWTEGNFLLWDNNIITDGAHVLCPGVCEIDTYNVITDQPDLMNYRGNINSGYSAQSTTLIRGYFGAVPHGVFGVIGNTGATSRNDYASATYLADETQFLFYSEFLIASHNLIVYGTGIANATSWHTKLAPAGEYFGDSITTNSSTVYAKVYSLYTTSYQLGAILSIPYGIAPNMNATGTCSENCISNSSLISGLGNSTFFGNQSSYVAGLNGTIIFFGISEPAYYYDVIAIFLVIAMALSFMLENEFVSIGIIAVLFAVGALGIILNTKAIAPYILLIMAMLYVVYYIVRNAPKWFVKR